MKVSVVADASYGGNRSEVIRVTIYSDQGGAFSSTFTPDLTQNAANMLIALTAWVKARMLAQFGVSPDDADIAIFGTPSKGSS